MKTARRLGAFLLMLALLLALAGCESDQRAALQERRAAEATPTATPTPTAASEDDRRLDGAVRRGPPTRISVRIEQVDGAIETTIADDAPGERRRALLDAIAERASTLSGTLEVEQGERGGTTLRVSLPVYAARV